MTQSYEFNEEQDREVKGLVLVMRGLGLLIYLDSGLLMALLFLKVLTAGETEKLLFPLMIATLFGTALFMVVGAFLLSASTKFKKIVTTEGRDIDHLMAGLSQFTRVFRVGTAGMWVLNLTLGGALLLIARSLGVLG